jgi:hypothetical protein
MALLAFDRDKLHVFGRDVRWAYFKAGVAGGLAAAMLVAALILTVHMFLVSELADEVRSGGKNRDIRAANKAQRLTMYNHVPNIFALSGAGFVFGIIAFRQYNIAKSEFPR